LLNSNIFKFLKYTIINELLIIIDNATRLKRHTAGMQLPMTFLNLFYSGAISMDQKYLDYRIITVLYLCLLQLFIILRNNLIVLNKRLRI